VPLAQFPVVAALIVVTRSKSVDALLTVIG